jgi:hypothetical protein
LRDWGWHLRFYASPAYWASSDGFSEGAEKDYVHHLAVIEALEDEGSEEGPILVLLEGESDNTGEQINHHENREEDQRAFHVL